jgi:tetratricopeptide (TPR) repeat protein
LGSLIAYFVETSVGIAVVATRTYVFLLLAILSVLVSGSIRGNAAMKQRSPKPLRLYHSPLPAYIAVAGSAVLVESWSFIVNTTAERSASSLFLRNWFVQPDAQQLKTILPGSLILLLLTIGAAVALIYGEKADFHLTRKDSRKITTVTLSSLIAVWLVMGFLAAVFWAAGDPGMSPPAVTSARAEARMTLYLVGLLFVLIATAWSLLQADSKKYASASTARSRSLWVLLPLAVGSFYLIVYLSVRPAWADIACHTARLYERGGNVSAAAAIYERASRLAPRRIPYLISLGRAQMNASAEDAGLRTEAVDSLQRALDLNPLDPNTVRNLGVLHIQMAETAGNAALRKAQLRKAISFFQAVAELAPNNRDVYGDLGRCHFLLGDHETARSFFDKSIEKYPDYARTYLFLGEMQYRMNDLQQSLESFRKAVSLDWRNVEARKSVGLMLSLLGRTERAIETDLKTLELAPRDPALLSRLSSLYFATGDYNSGLEFARRAYDAMPSNDRPNFEYFLGSLQNKVN